MKIKLKDIIKESVVEPLLEGKLKTKKERWRTNKNYKAALK